MPAPQPTVDFSLPITHALLYASQQADPVLQKCFTSVVSADRAGTEAVAFLIDNTIMMHNWCPMEISDSDWNVV